MTPPRICHAADAYGNAPDNFAARARGLGFDHVLFAEPPDTGMAAAAQAAGLGLLLDLDIARLQPDHPLVRAHPEYFAMAEANTGGGIDPQFLNAAPAYMPARAHDNPGPFLAWWTETLSALIETGARGFRVQEPLICGPEFWRTLLDALRARHGGADGVPIFIADATGLPRDDQLRLKSAGFDYCLSSLPWWDGRSAWLAEEYAALSQVAPVMALVEAVGRMPPAAAEARRTRLALAALTGTGVMMPMSFESAPGNGARELEASVRAMNALVAENAFTGALRCLTGAGAPLTVLLRGDAPDLRLAETALLAVINSNPTLAAEPGPDFESVFGEWTERTPLAGWDENGAGPRLRPSEVRLLTARRAKPIVMGPASPASAARMAAQESRIVIANVTPGIDAGAFAVKRGLGETIAVEPDIFTDGHPVIAAELLFKTEDAEDWSRHPMRLVANDRWTASFSLRRLGRHVFAVEAWIDVYGSVADGLSKKRAAQVNTDSDIAQGKALLAAARKHAARAARAPLDAILAALETLGGEDRATLLLAPETIAAMRHADTRARRIRSAPQPVEAEREAARFASWYELFPRSQSSDPAQSGDPARHGTFADVAARLPAISVMGFDVLYLPPIHPIGATNRKGRNNALSAQVGDPGSTYAIGAAEGGHDSIHPALGTLADFRALVSAARGHGIEIALDFAVQCSPDHPWLKEHPGWFDWLPDGTVKHAENPPKTYEDIVNVDFYARDAVPGLWLALRDILLFWADEGVRIFRVDNPHTKPFAFWRWLIDDVRARHADVIFLAEAFTRPKIMLHLAKVGFSQSYTYFTWRNTKAELTGYLEELTAAPQSDFFRPHFFVNTPDINPLFLQGGGRAAFLIRAALAATLSGLWGLYSGFELCEAAALPGREEYRDSEKYEIRARDWTAPGNIIREIAQLNRLRRSEPALQTHLGLTFYNAFNDRVLYYGKHVPGTATRILVVVSLNPHGVEEADFEMPLWEWSLPDGGALAVHDLLHGASHVWRGKMQHVRLTPEEPYAIWRAGPAEAP